MRYVERFTVQGFCRAAGALESMEAVKCDSPDFWSSFGGRRASLGFLVL